MGTISFSIPRQLVQSITNSLDIDNFVETGTLQGNTSFWAATIFKNVYSIEINPTLVKLVSENPACKTNIELITGDSRTELSKLMPRLKGRSIFFLDAYWQNNKFWKEVAGGKDNECPLMEELEAISANQNAIIFINEARHFFGPLPYPHKSEQWPTFEQVFAKCKKLFPDSYITIVDGVIVCVPQDTVNLVNAYWVETYGQRFYAPDPQPYKRSFVERVISKLKRMTKKKTAKEKEDDTFVLDINNNRWFEAHCNLFFDEHKWLQREDFKSVVDVGANVGQFGRKMRRFFPHAHIYSFEPIPVVYKTLVENFAEDKNFTPFNVGLGEENGKMQFFLNEFSDSSSMLKMGDLHKENFPYTKNEKMIEVDVKRLDDCIDATKIQKPYLLKLDVQGFEKQVIDGGLEIVRNAEMIITEASYKELYEGQTLFDGMYETIKSFGFQYIGNLEQMDSAFNGEPLQGDAIFKKIRKDV
ncbi:FkbM family methyltransferase [Dysgonomonas sp. PH5-45]|uniref:FkbM family methyltransferase n=1 Tax=unclassified Dysgonomonas TaxID=2630389 RepID=UPI0024757610|nr:MULTISPECIES: FkbM family methyltransferase [unclassified Dysgonomonas]MDH6355287.1 FkbM family methyltransferase [Dysgonomonas sp. PH5-45]MDH6388187.1 FkbM family methyltransferase [Dysgonomonas sp. PH5-37]